MPGALQVRLAPNNPGAWPVHEAPYNGGAMPVDVTTTNLGAVPVRISTNMGSMPVRVMSGSLSPDNPPDPWADALFHYTSGDSTAAATFTRNSLATFTDSGGLVRFAPHNYLIWPEDVTNGAWTKDNTTVTLNNTTAPDGTTTAARVLENTSTSPHQLYQLTGFVFDVGSTVTVSFYVKALGRDWIALNLQDTAARNTWINLTTGTVGTNSAGNTVTITPLTDGWYRCTISRVVDATAVYAVVKGASADGFDTYLGDPTKGFYVWHPQIERNITASEYVATTFAPVFDRVRDAHYINGVRYTLLEGARTALALRSQEFDNAAWALANATVDPDDATAPDGATTADKLTHTGAGGLVRQGISALADTTYTLSVWVKEGNTTHATVRFTDLAANSFEARLVFADGTTIAGANVGSAVLISQRAEAYASGWYRFSVTGTTHGSDANYSIAIAFTNASGTTANGGFGHIWGAGVEAATFASSYIPTAGSTVTRAADAMSFPYTALPQEMTVYVRGVDLGTSSGSNLGLFSVGSVTNSGYRLLGYSPAGYVILHGNNSPAQIGDGVTAAIGATLEYRGVLASDGDIQLGTSINGGSETVSANTPSEALGGAWNTTSVLVNAYQGSAQGFFAFRDLIIAEAPIRDIAYFRALVSP